jgi:hypothetical protein
VCGIQPPYVTPKSSRAQALFQSPDPAGGEAIIVVADLLQTAQSTCTNTQHAGSSMRCIYERRACSFRQMRFPCILCVFVRACTNLRQRIRGDRLIERTVEEMPARVSYQNCVLPCEFSHPRLCTSHGTRESRVHTHINHGNHTHTHRTPGPQTRSKPN